MSIYDWEWEGGMIPTGPVLCRCECHSMSSYQVSHVAPCCCIHRNLFLFGCPDCEEEE